MRLVVERNEIKTKVKISFSERIVRFVVPCSKRPTVFIKIPFYYWEGGLIELLHDQACNEYSHYKAKDVDLILSGI
jgi:hypothetical protein